MLIIKLINSQQHEDKYPPWYCLLPSRK
jgi:hypothetical protein